ncbi:zinc-dependent alcohol dehydrogenase [Hornefia butyriciproducens]|uniref:zinc-dependent alcohol dehydrogenase n=1 Tax=Hornefia butyriciproducens TaxID=2652293 RepID=UPI003F8CC761
MKTAVYLGKKSVEVREVPVPVPGPRDVVIRNIFSSICGTDAAVYTHGPGTGHRITVGGEFGHETVSVVSAIGYDVTDFRIGDRVYPYPLYAKNDTSRAGTLGGFSEYILIPEAKPEHSLYPVPKEISDRLACLTEPFTVGCHAARRSQPKAGERAVVFGAGTIGIAAAVALRFFGIDKVIICDLSELRLDIAAGLGFEVFNMRDEQNFLPKACKYFGEAPSLTGKTADIDIVLDAAGAPALLNLFFVHGKTESRFVSVAVNNTARSIDLLHMTYAQQSIIGSGGYTPEDVRDVFRIMELEGAALETLITNEYPLDDIDSAIQRAADPEHALNVVINFSL